MFLSAYGDDTTDDSGVSVDSSGMSVVTVEASRSLPIWPLLLVLGIVAYMALSEKTS